MIGIRNNHAFLDFAVIPLNLTMAELRSFGILVLEIGVGLSVLGTLVLIFDQLVSGAR
jgi:hypothetical protein